MGLVCRRGGGDVVNIKRVQDRLSCSYLPS